MNVSVNLYSNKEGELNSFLSKFYNTNLEIESHLKWNKTYKNPIEIAEIIGIFIDNIDDFLITMWICLDKNLYINVTEKNGDNIIKLAPVCSNM